MAEERTEAPTTRRRQEVRKKGQTARSQDLTAALAFLAALFGLRLFVGTARDQATRLIVTAVDAIGHGRTAAVPWSAAGLAATLAGLFLPLFIVGVCVALLGSFAQGGFVFAPRLLRPQAERVNPIAGAKRIVSLHGLIQSGRTLAKFALVTLVAALVFSEHLTELTGLGRLELGPALAVLTGFAWELLFKSALVLVGVGALDWLWERRRFLQSIRMTKQQVKEEFRQSEGDPQVRARLRRKREALIQEMLKNVRTADVLITNPSHFAVALHYDQASMNAPTVVAKGLDHLALRLREAATEARVPVLENPPLARSLYRLCPVGGQIPAELYVAVAEVLAWVYRLRARRDTHTTVPPSG